jgi:CubicO group peptidase (beta-lactamase class C family)
LLYAQGVDRRRFLATAASLAAVQAPLVGCSSGKSDANPSSDAGDAGTDASNAPLETFIPAQMDVAHIPGLSAAIVKGGKVVWSGAYGYADVEAKRPVTVDTIFLLASISKTFTATAAMQMYEQGKLKLDDDVDDRLPFKLRNPSFLDVPITYRMLLTHMSSISESYVQLFALIGPGDSTVPMKDFLESFLVDGGKYYHPEVFRTTKPGTEYAYSQVGATAVGYLVELISGTPFDAYVKKQIIEKLGLVDTSFRLADLDLARLAHPYTYLSSKGQVKNDDWGCAFYPAATMHSTAPQLAKYLASFIRVGGGDSVRLVSQATQDEMFRVQNAAVNPDQGILWNYRDVEGARCIGHTGGAPGVSTTMCFRPSDGVGVVTLTNSDVHIRVATDHDESVDAYRAIEARLFREAAKY